ncbi:hypothetical protein AZI11_04115 [Levilactobacillus brevis]|uniref:ATP-binding protein n=1 Tax=Levilactobacillus brevis TaxID=1580 RepID=UPI000A20705B|nr:ATP-binding protein [Levilactobacillus brevis]ARN92151.1 hypothetical protein AZI11_04115 [Levilactobacillus brevis]ARN94844.1 hypothetical protein AZI12_04135 [Levilactobacillus brevis]
MKKEINECITELNDLSLSKDFSNYISKIRFPHYKNFKADTTINFSFPLTVLVGKNGTGKSSILYALYGAPSGSNTGNYWFSTATDPIEEQNDEGIRQSFVYSFFDEDEKEQDSLNLRISNSNDPDYWESSRPLKLYGLDPKQIRPKKISKGIIFLNFKSMISAYDKLFHFGKSGTKSLSQNLLYGQTTGAIYKKRKSYIRLKSKQLDNILNEKEAIIKGPYNTNQNTSKIDLSQKELFWISDILGHKYSSGVIINHKLYNTWGYSIYLKQSVFSYTEAHAGSGEFAVVILVHNLLKIKDNSLVLLDEVETSLHPGAQTKITRFLLNLIADKKLQIVISTHSPQLVQSLPENAIKKVYLDDLSNKVVVQNDCLPTEAFNEIGFSAFEKCNVYVEDINAKLVCKAVITNAKNATKYSTLNIEYGNGANDLIARILSDTAKNIRNEFFILDGDQKSNDIDMTHDFSVEESKDLDFLREFVLKMAHTKKFPLPSNPQKQLQIEYLNKVIDFWKTHVFYLPEKDPETIIWNTTTLTDFCGILSINTNLDPEKKKKTFKLIANECNCTEQNNNSSSAEYETLIKMLLKSWIQKEDNCYWCIVEEFDIILSRFNAN